MNLKYINSSIFISISLLIINGCTASSASRRFEADQKKIEEDTTQIVRFNVEPKKINLDTLEYDDADLQDVDEEPNTIVNPTDSVLIKRLLSKFTDNSNNLNVDSTDYKEKVIMEIIKYLNTPYKFGGTTWKGIDCSAFTQTVFNQSFSLELPRSAREQYQVGQIVDEKTDLKFGDLVFFNTRKRVKPGHVGIYIGENLFAHASRKAGVTVSSLDEDYYVSRYMGARRIEGLPLN
jgi:lipoprotein Spr